MAGNDIVDLDLAREPLGEKRLRFIQKVFTPREQEVILSGEAGLWAIWAMKEAIYKAHHRRFDLPRSYQPKRIEVAINMTRPDIAAAQGEYDGHTYWGSGILTSGYLHFTASCNQEIFIFQEVHPISVDIKHRLIDLISKKTGLRIDDISAGKRDHNIPQLYYKNKLLQLPFSISHHGKYAGFSFQLINY